MTSSYHKWFIRAAALWLAGIAAVQPLPAQDTAAILEAPAGKPAALQFKEAHASLVAADAARDRGDYDGAIKLYQGAATDYIRLSASYPDWEPGMTRFRRSYCENQIRSAEMRRERARSEGVAAAEQAPEPAPPRPNSGSPAAAEDKAAVLKQLCETASDLIRQDKTIEARELLVRGIGIDPDHAATRMLLGAIHCRDGEYDQAVYVLRELADEEPENARVRVLLGAAYFGVSRILSAEAELRKALELDPQLPEAHYDMAQVLMAMDSPDRLAARQSYARSVELGAPTDPILEKALEGADQ